MRLSSTRPSSFALEYSTFGVGIFLFITPWLFGFSAQAAPTWNAWGMALVVAALAAYAGMMPNSWWKWPLLAIAGWLFAAPWLLGFTASVTAFWTHIGASIGLLTIVAAAIWSSDDGNRPVAA